MNQIEVNCIMKSEIKILKKDSEMYENFLMSKKIIIKSDMIKAQCVRIYCSIFNIKKMKHI